MESARKQVPIAIQKPKLIELKPESELEEEEIDLERETNITPAD